MVVDQFYFPKCKWSRMMQKLDVGFDETLVRIFSDTQCLAIVNMHNDVHVRKLEQEGVYTRYKLLY